MVKREPDTRPEKLDSLLDKSSERLNNQKHGGKRNGAGRRAGSKNKTTIEREVIKQALIDRIHTNADRLITAQMNKAMGETYLMVQHTIGTGVRQKRETEIVTNPETIKQFIDDELDYGRDTEYYYMTTKPADNYALQGLLDRAFGKADSKVENTGEQKLIIETRHHGAGTKAYAGKNS